MRRPNCAHRNCNRPAKITTTRYRKYFNKFCSSHTNLRAAKNAGFDSVYEYEIFKDKLTAKKRGITLTQVRHERMLKIAKNKGFNTISEYKNSFHPYKKYKKDYCENRDGRLGWKCTTKITSLRILEVDHKNGKPNDHRPRNLQTLCRCCHTEKSFMKKDHLTPGRRTLKCK